MKRHGMTVSSFASISLETAPAHGGAPKTTTHFRPDFACQGFGVTILSAGQGELSDHFADAGDESQDRLAGVDTDTPRYRRSIHPGRGLAYSTAASTKTLDSGTSLIFIGEILAARQFDGQPLVYHNRQYVHIS